MHTDHMSSSGNVISVVTVVLKVDKKAVMAVLLV
jgi:hypothetical protein